jgi:pantoate--beta-alanine ligase
LRTYHQIKDLRAHLRVSWQSGRVIGFVPTMGALHDGHRSLIRKARTECDEVVVSVFVNPTQFGPQEDYSKYPRTLEADSRMAQEMGVDAMFAPPAEVMYPFGPDATVEVGPLTTHWEGACRPGHFRGVTTVCAKLFCIIQPRYAYFGMKDYQQYRVVERMVADLHMGLSVVPVPTVREADGLAMSSRNAYLSPEHRATATCLYQALNEAATLHTAGERDAAILREAMHARLSGERDVEIVYADVADAQTLEPVSAITGPAVALGAIRLGSTRLIDNVVLP